MCSSDLVPLEAVDGVIGGADEGHVALLDEAADGQLGDVYKRQVQKVSPLFVPGAADVGAGAAAAKFPF